MESEVVKKHEPTKLIDFNIESFNAIDRTTLLIAYACCDIIIKSKDHGKPYRSITRFINQLSACVRIDGLQIRGYTVQDLDSLQGVLINLIYK